MTHKKTAPKSSPSTVDHTTVPGLVSDIRRLIHEARAGLAATVNSALTLLYWRIGQRIRTEVLKGARWLRRADCLRAA